MATRDIKSAKSRGTVTLVALCFVAVMAIALGGYIAVCSRAMNLSNRTFHSNLSKQLAEVGIDEALRAFNKNDWSDWSNAGTAADWTLDTTNKRATATITFPTGKFGQGVVGSVKIRIDNYGANQLDSTWYTLANYRVNDVVGYNGSWYRCVRAHSGQTPSGLANMAYWVPEPMPAPLWNSTTTYKAEDVVYYTSLNSWYRCILAPTANQSPVSTTYWTSIPRISVDNGYVGTAGEVLNFFGTWYYYSSGWRSTPNPPNSYAPVISWCWRIGYSYGFNDLVAYGSPVVWYRCKTAHTSSAAIVPTNTTYWETALSGMYGWSSTTNYNMGDVVYSGTTLYRCIQANSNKTPASNPNQWSAYPNISRDWNSSKRYGQNDTVRYRDVSYLSIHSGATNIGQTPSAAASSYWIGANTTTASYQWNANTAYAAGDYKCYGGVWYKCLAATTANAGHSPNNTTYWTAAWRNSWQASSTDATGAPVIYAEGTITILGSPPVKTQLRATIAPAPLFPNAAAATTTISANSGGTVDSYDSAAGSYASQVGTATNYSAVIAAGEATGTAVTLSSTAVKGYVAAPSSSTSPFAPLLQMGTSASVKGMTSPVSPNVDTSRVSRSPFIPQFDTLPSGGLASSWANVAKGTQLSTSYTTNIGTAGASTPSRYYYNGNLTIGTAALNLLRINGPVILYINGDLFITASGSTGRIEIASTGSAEIHIAGAFKADAGGDGILSYTNDPKSLIIISDTTSTANHYYSEGVNPLYGVIYVPYSTSNTGYYNDNNSTNIYGAVSANKITYSGANLNIHYDTSLRYATFGGVDQSYTINNWRELPATEWATMP